MDWTQDAKNASERLDLDALKAQIASLEAPPRVDVARQLCTTGADGMPGREPDRERDGVRLHVFRGAAQCEAFVEAQQKQLEKLN